MRRSTTLNRPARVTVTTNTFPVPPYVAAGKENTGIVPCPEFVKIPLVKELSRRLSSISEVEVAPPVQSRKKLLVKLTPAFKKTIFWTERGSWAFKQVIWCK